MNLVVGRSEYPKLAKHLDNEIPRCGYDSVIVSAFEQFTAYHPTEKLTGFDQKQFQSWLAIGHKPDVTVCRPMEASRLGLSTGISISAENARRYEKGEWRLKVGGALNGKEVYQATAQLLAQLVIWAIWNRDQGKPAQWQWTAETPAQMFLDYLYGPHLMFWC